MSGAPKCGFSGCDPEVHPHHHDGNWSKCDQKGTDMCLGCVLADRDRLRESNAEMFAILKTLEEALDEAFCLFGKSGKFSISRGQPLDRRIRAAISKATGEGA